MPRILKRKIKTRISKKKLRALNLMKRSIDTANSEVDLFAKIPDLKLYKNEATGNAFSISCILCNECSREQFSWMINLLEENMSELYKSCEWGWDPKAKLSEMSEESARYLVAYSSTDKNPIAFSHFRFDMDNDVNVVYCYEIQLDKTARKQGLAKHIMKVLETLCSYYNMYKVVLTVFNHNRKAFDFFSSQGYTLDETSPQNFSVNACYSILSKVNKEYTVLV